MDTLEGLKQALQNDENLQKKMKSIMLSLHGGEGKKQQKTSQLASEAARRMGYPNAADEIMAQEKSKVAKVSTDAELTIADPPNKEKPAHK